jgi:CDGSH-type Zn-finger protein
VAAAFCQEIVTGQSGPGESGSGLTSDVAGGIPADRAATGGTASVSELLWQLSLDATRLRVRRHQAGGAPPELAEAVAALQDLACALAPAAGGAAARAAQLRELQASLPAGIQTARDGPYLVTNGPATRTPLGLPLPLPPQVALCRCGGSARKPFCDGSHAASGSATPRIPSGYRTGATPTTGLDGGGRTGPGRGQQPSPPRAATGGHAARSR